MVPTLDDSVSIDLLVEGVELFCFFFEDEETESRGYRVFFADAIKTRLFSLVGGVH